MAQTIPRPMSRPVPPSAGSDAQDLGARLTAARAKHEELSRESSRVSGELDALKKRCGEVEVRCKAEFGCSSAELPLMVKQMREVAEAAVAGAEVGLGMKEASAVFGDAM